MCHSLILDSDSQSVFMARLLLVTLTCISCQSITSAQSVSSNDPILRAYVDTPDSSYKWTVKKESKIGLTAYAEIIMTSQTWREIRWRHQLFVVTPQSVAANNRSALLVIAGGSWRDRLADPEHAGKLPSEAVLFAATAEKLKMPVAVLLQVPNQPLFGDLYEDEIISHTFEQFLKSGDTSWPLLLPMAKSAVRAMDTVQSYLDQQETESEHSASVEKFIVTGASKRGWTTWLSAVVDDRVQAIAPMVIDVLDMPRQMEYMEQCWGAQSEQIRDYTEKGLHKAFESETGKRLISIVDPYAYRRQLTLPKLLLLGTNDTYWPVDAMNLYWDGLKGDKHVVYVPNAGHGLDDLPRVLGALVNFARLSADGETLPGVGWKHLRTNTTLRLSVVPEGMPKAVKLWVAESEDRDFRDARWKSFKVRQNGKSWMAETPAPSSGFKAIFGEVTYPGEAMDYPVSTAIRVYAPR